jgi:hypothetical protein
LNVKLNAATESSNGPSHSPMCGRLGGAQKRAQPGRPKHGASLGIDVEVVNRHPGVRGFHVVKRPWVVERSIGWIMLHRRLARDYETLPASSEAMIHVASIDDLTKRITDETTPTWRGTY